MVDSPLFIQVALNVCRSLITGDLKAGDSLPELNSMASGFEVNKHIAQKACEVLEQSGVVTRDEDHYTFTPNAPEKAGKLLRDEFEKYDIPELTKKMDFLGITAQEIMLMIDKNKARA
jgi:DNA-binding transcriptional regulator YhcF (GntR family)